MKGDIDPNHLLLFREMLDGIGQVIELDRPYIEDTLVELCWPEGKEAVLFFAVTREVEKRCMLLQPCIGVAGAPNSFSQRDPVLIFCLMDRRNEFPYAMAQFSSGRRVLAILDDIVLDTADVTTKCKITNRLIAEHESPLTRSLITHLVRTFPKLSERGERIRTRTLTALSANAPS